MSRILRWLFLRDILTPEEVKNGVDRVYRERMALFREAQAIIDRNSYRLTVSGAVIDAAQLIIDYFRTVEALPVSKENNEILHQCNESVRKMIAISNIQRSELEEFVNLDKLIEEGEKN